LSSGGEVFKPIGGREEVLDKDTPILVDSKGTVLHIYPHRDSIETCVTDTTRRIITIAAGVPGVEKELRGESSRDSCQITRENRVELL